MNEDELIQCKAEWQNVDRMPRGEERNILMAQWCEDWIEILMEDLDGQRETIEDLNDQLDEEYLNVKGIEGAMRSNRVLIATLHDGSFQINSRENGDNCERTASSLASVFDILLKKV